ncbi:MAG: hypothetical protein RLY86_912 [Pseudomonadota bacterium]|jgi:hypothetical protein
MDDTKRTGRPTSAVAEEFLPSTFAERGVAVPFTTPLLAQARLRLDRNEQFEFLLPNFTGGKGVYVMPWKTVPSMMTVTLHDRLLFEALSKLETHSPETIRRASLEVQASGVAGPDAAVTAGRCIDRDNQYLVLTQFILVTELLKLVNIGAQDLLRPGMTAEDSKRLARQALAKVAAMVKLPADQLSAVVDRLGAAASPVGLPQCPEQGRLRTLAARLGTFCDELTTWAGLDASDVSELGRFVAGVGRHTLELVKMRLTQLDKVCAEPKQIIHDEPRFRAAITGHVDRISWLLDGWDYILSTWESVRHQPGEPQQTAVADISRLVPVIPKEEITMSAADFDMEALAKIQRRWVRMNEDWRTGALDMPAVMRIEGIKAGVA